MTPGVVRGDMSVIPPTGMTWRPSGASQAAGDHRERPHRGTARSEQATQGTLGWPGVAAATRGRQPAPPVLSHAVQMGAGARGTRSGAPSRNQNHFAADETN